MAGRGHTSEAEVCSPNPDAPTDRRGSLLAVEAAIHAVVACAVAAWLVYLRRADPVALIRAVTEDGWVEFATAVAFALAGLLLLASSVKSGPRSRRVLWSIYGLGALFIAGEEISWGQRLAGIPTPELWQRLNYQQEMNLHNLDLALLLDPKFLIFLLLVIAVLLGTSTGLWVFSYGLFERWRGRGAPLVSPALAPLIVAAGCSLFWLPVFRRAEIGELYLGLAALAWATDLNGFATPSRPSNVSRVIASRLGVLLVVAVLSSLSVAMFSTWPNATALNAAAEIYVSSGHYADAARVYDFIAANPTCRAPETEIGQARLLLATGKPLEAQRLLFEAAARLESERPMDANRGRLLQAKIEIYTMLDDSRQADRVLQEALVVADHLLRQASDPDERARALWSIAQAFAGRRKWQSAREYGDRARASARSPSLRDELDRWFRGLEPRRRAMKGVPDRPPAALESEGSRRAASAPPR